jgi:hypothetical protein
VRCSMPIERLLQGHCWCVNSVTKLCHCVTPSADDLSLCSFKTSLDLIVMAQLEIYGPRPPKLWAAA